MTWARKDDVGAWWDGVYVYKDVDVYVYVYAWGSLRATAGTMTGTRTLAAMPRGGALLRVAMRRVAIGSHRRVGATRMSRGGVDALWDGVDVYVYVYVYVYVDVDVDVDVDAWGVAAGYRGDDDRNAHLG